MNGRADFRSVYIRTKTRMPTPPAELIQRPRLMDLREVASARLVLLQAPAGYGKTSLLLQWCERLMSSDARVAWFTSDEGDRDPKVFLGYLVQALQEAGHPVGSHLQTFLARESFYTWQVLATQISNELVDITTPLHLVIDDVQNLRDSEALECLRYLIESTPPELHFILSSRIDPGIPLGRLRAVGRVLELRAPELRFIGQETATYLATRAHVQLSDARLAAIESRTEGWIVGLKLLGMAMQWHGDESMDIVPISGEHREVAEYFAEDVFARQPREVQDFLLRTCILDRLNPALCDSLPEVHGSRELLDHCDAGGLFLVALDRTRTWYRYHSLFADFLRRQLNDRLPGLADELRVAASRWLEESGFHVEAFDYALRGNNPIRAAEILDRQCDAMWSAGRQQVIQTLAERLPPHVQALYPRIMLALAWRLLACWKIDLAQQLIAVCRARQAEVKKEVPETTEQRNLRHRILHRESQIALHLYQLDEVQRLSCQLVEETCESDDDPYLTASVLATLQYAQREQFQLTNIHRLMEQSREAMQRTGFSHGKVFQSAHAGPSYMLAGNVQEAARILSDGLIIARDLTGRGSSLGSIVALHLAQLFYEQNSVEACAELMEEYFHADEPIGVADQLVAGWITHSRLLRLREGLEASLEALVEAAAFGERHRATRLQLFVAAEQVRVLLRLGRPDDAARYAKRMGLGRNIDQPGGRNRATVADSAQALASCYLAAAQNRVGEALVVARRWRSHVTSADAVHAAVEWGVLVSQLLLLSGDRKAAQRSLGQALVQAAPARFSRVFLDEGEPVALLLRRMLGAEPRAHDPTENFVRELLAALDGPSGPQGEIPQSPVLEPIERSAVVGRLSTRELEILALAGSGQLNKQISEKLGLTEGTVKWYLQQVFDKLGIRNRARAAIKARQLGLIT